MNNTEEAIEFVESIKPGKVQAYDTIRGLNRHYEENLSKVQQLLGDGLRYKKLLIAIKSRFTYLTQMNSSKTARYTYEEIMCVINDMEQTFFPKTPSGRTAELLKELDKDVHELLKICEERMDD